MSGFISKQPNGLYCRFSTVVDCPTHYNMTRNDYLSNITGTVSSVESATDILENYLKPFSEVVRRFLPNNMSADEFMDLLKIMHKEVKQ